MSTALSGINDKVMQLWSYNFRTAHWNLESTTVQEEMLDLNTCKFVMAKDNAKSSFNL